MQELDSRTVNNLGPQETKVAKVSKMKEKIASKFLPHNFSSMFTHKCLTCYWQSTVSDVAVQ